MRTQKLLDDFIQLINYYERENVWKESAKKLEPLK